MLADLLNVALDGGVSSVEVDMAYVDFVDIAGLRVLSRAHRMGALRGVALSLRQPSPHLIWLLRLTGSTALLEVEQERMTSSPHPS